MFLSRKILTPTEFFDAFPSFPSFKKSAKRILTNAVLCISVALLSFGCARRGETDALPAISDEYGDWYSLEIGKAGFVAQLAVSDPEKMRGLMNRPLLPENGAMIFVYEIPQRASFWMKNTSIPLDIGFFDADGTLTEVRTLLPFCLDSVNSARDDIAFCMETNRGWFEKRGLFPPAKLDMRKLKAAIKAKTGK